MLERIGNVTLNLLYYSGEDLYSDGKIEEDLLQICKNGTEERSLLESNDWPILYHLSKKREHLLDWFELKKYASVLEIGAGCGALTGLFCRKAEKVTCVELSKRRSLINAYRNRASSNLTIYVGNFNDIQLEEQYDYIMLVGVLEYAASYIPSTRPYHDLLARLKRLLKPGGQIIIAIENRMGLKYFSGANEDHTGVLFAGLEQYNENPNIRTFTKPELISLLQETGLGEMKFYYPMPDYKLPDSVYSDQYKFKVGDMRNISQIYSDNCYLMYSEEILFDTFCKDGLFEYFANSFLVFCRKDESVDV